MTTLSHWVLDDLGGESGTLESRVGDQAAVFGSVVGGSYVDTYLNRDRADTVPAKARDSSTQNLGSGAVSGSTAANCLTPVPGTKPVRTYEIIARSCGFTFVDNADAGSNACMVDIDNNGHAVIDLISDNDALTLQVNDVVPLETIRFHHVVVVVDLTNAGTTGAIVKAYLDGELIGTDGPTAVDLSPWGDDLFVDGEAVIMAGHNSGAGGSGIVEMMVHDVELTADEIQRRSFFLRAVNAANGL